MTALLLGCGMDPGRLDNYGQNALHLAAIGANVRIVELLMRKVRMRVIGGLCCFVTTAFNEQRVDSNLADVNGRTALGVALKRGPSHKHIADFIRFVLVCDK